MATQTSQQVVYEINVDSCKMEYNTHICTALKEATARIDELNDTIETVKKLQSNCDKIDYALAVGIGALCGIVDIFLVGKPGESPLGNITDKWFENRTVDFAKLCGWEENGENSTSSAIRYLEKKFKIPYDQRGAGDAGSVVFDLSPSNHHFKSLAHNPSLLGLFFSVLDQFRNESHFISGGQLISLQKADNGFELCGGNIPSKIFCAFTNWFGHLISDISGSSGSKGRGMGIPSPLWTWMNDVIAIKQKLNIPVSEFDKTFNELAIEIYTNGYDIRFQTAQMIPVFINEIIVRLAYSVRRVIKYYSETDSQSRSFKELWNKCEPFKNSTVKRMLTVAHGTFLAIDTGDAVIRSFIAGGGSFNPAEFCMRLNVVGVGRFTICVYGEVKGMIKKHKYKKETKYAQMEKKIVNEYIDGLHTLSKIYDDKELTDIVENLKNNMYVSAFEKSIKLAEQRSVPDENFFKNKSDIDDFFKRRKKT